METNYKDALNKDNKIKFVMNLLMAVYEYIWKDHGYKKLVVLSDFLNKLYAYPVVEGA